MTIQQHPVSEQTDLILSEAARKHIVSYLEKTPNLGVRFSIKKKGCSGFAYVTEDVKAPLEGDHVLSLNETYFICWAHDSIPYLKGTYVDYVKEGLNAKFVFQNPNQTGQCGCGESFTVE